MGKPQTWPEEARAAARLGELPQARLRRVAGSEKLYADAWLAGRVVACAWVRGSRAWNESEYTLGVLLAASLAGEYAAAALAAGVWAGVGHLRVGDGELGLATTFWRQLRDAGAVPGGPEASR